jgi:hypothetical protein
MDSMSFSRNGAPHCGTGVPARQIAENGLEIDQTPGRCKRRPSNGLTAGPGSMRAYRSSY